MPNEFEIIEHFFTKRTLVRQDVVLASGDDCALLTVPAGQVLAISMDTLVAGVHFPATTAPEDIGYKAVAVNLSDLAAMGAQPAWFTGSLTLPNANTTWLERFTNGFFSLLDRYQVALVGGDLSHGPLSITLQAHGFIPEHQALRRNAAQPGDLIYVTGTLGDAGLGLRYFNQSMQLSPATSNYLIKRLNRPSPRVEVGLALRGIAHAAIDISDGLYGDLKHILELSHVGATVWLDQLPFSSALQENLSSTDAWQLALTAGDDYELCFTVPAQQQAALNDAFKNIDCPYQQIGIVETRSGLRLLQPNGLEYNLPNSSYTHFV